MRSGEALYLLTSRVDGFAGWGAATIQWLRAGRDAPPAPYSDLIGVYDLLAKDTRLRAERAVLALFTRDEAAALGLFFAEVYPGLAARLRLAALTPPLHADELTAVVEAVPGPDASRCLVRLPPQGIASPVPILGVAAPWPWPDLEPADIARLIDVRERFGYDPVPRPLDRPDSPS